MTRATQLGGLLLLLLLVACGAGDGRSGDGSGDAEALHEGLAAHFAGDHPDARKQEAADCFAEELSGRTSSERLRDAGVLDADGAVVTELPVLPEDVAVDWAAAQLACSDFVAESTRAGGRHQGQGRRRAVRRLPARCPEPGGAEGGGS